MSSRCQDAPQACKLAWHRGHWMTKNHLKLRTPLEALVWVEQCLQGFVPDASCVKPNLFDCPLVLQAWSLKPASARKARDRNCQTLRSYIGQPDLKSSRLHTAWLEMTVRQSGGYWACSVVSQQEQRKACAVGLRASCPCPKPLTPSAERRARPCSGLNMPSSSVHYRV